MVLVGAGKMGGAMLEGWLARKLPPKQVVVLEPQPSKAIRALSKRGVRLNPKGAIGKRDLNNFQPRLGMAWNFRPKLVFRASFGIMTVDGAGQG